MARGGKELEEAVRLAEGEMRLDARRRLAELCRALRCSRQRHWAGSESSGACSMPDEQEEDDKEGFPGS